MKQFYHFSVLLLTSSLLFGCSKSTKEQAPIIQNQLSSDTNFIKVVNLEQELNNYILMLADSKGLTIQEFKNKIQTLNDKDLHSTKESKFLNEYIGNENVLYLTEYAKTYSIIWSKLNKRYNYISMQSIDEACKQLYAKRYNSITGISSSISSVKTNSIISVNKLNDCGWRYSLCMAGATAAAILCHANCIGLTASLGTPVCVILCGTLEVAAGVACIDNFCPIP